MANPNIVNVTTIYGKTAGVNLSTTNATAILSNAASSGKCLKVDTLNVANYTAYPTSITVSYYDTADSSGNQYRIIGSINIPAYSTLAVIDKSTIYYLQENTSIYAIAAATNTLSVTITYEEIS